ncbi:Cyclin-B2-4 [Capsicum chinense]|nr:Cyclin-B2-4 [Capsicum chinense]
MEKTIIAVGSAKATKFPGFIVIKVMGVLVWLNFDVKKKGDLGVVQLLAWVRRAPKLATDNVHPILQEDFWTYFFLHPMLQEDFWTYFFLHPILQAGSWTFFYFTLFFRQAPGLSFSSPYSSSRLLACYFFTLFFRRAPGFKILVIMSSKTNRVEYFIDPNDWFKSDPRWRGDSHYHTTIMSFLDDTQLSLLRKEFFGNLMKLDSKERFYSLATFGGPLNDTATGYYDVPIFVQHTKAMMEEIDRMDEEIEIEDVEDWSVVDIDSSDKKNELTIVEYIDNIYAYYKKAEGMLELDGFFPSEDSSWEAYWRAPKVQHV